MGKMTMALVMGVLTVSTWSAFIATAAEHDRDCMPVGQEGTDASFGWAGAKELTDFNCTGEMLQNADNDDWYFLVAPVGADGNPFAVNLCPTGAKTGPWNPDVEIFWRNDLPPHIIFVGTIQPPSDGTRVGDSHNLAGCDSVVVPSEHNTPGLLGKRIYLHVIRTSGDGFYNLVVT